MSSDPGSPLKKGHSPQRVAAPRCHGWAGAVPGQPDPWSGWSQLRSPRLAPLSLDAFNPQGKGCNRTAESGLEGQDAPGDGGKSKQRGPQAAQGGLGAWEL